MNIPLGQFELTEVVAEGAMGQVWRGVHRDTGVEVAVKVITGENAADWRYRESFRREVQAIARLNHPRIVGVFDYGLIPEAAVVVSGGRLQSNSPWLAMEYAPLGSMAGYLPAPDWSTAYVILLQVLDALAHAHARDIIHRDIKPANLLVMENEDGELTLKLSDFGIAHALVPDPNEADASAIAATAGTPTYMSPEQFRGQWRDFGPWTDLYAVGCLAWELVSGRPPFRDDDLERLSIQHLLRPAPPLDATIETPPGFEAWVQRMMDKPFNLRFQRAADAAWALMELGQSVGTSGQLDREWVERSGDDDDNLPTDPSRPPRPTIGGARRMEHSLPFPGVALPGPALYGLSSSGGDRSKRLDEVPLVSTPDSALQGQDSLPPLPHDWSAGLDQPAPLSFTNVGLGLFDLREPPFVGRESSRDLVWRAFGQVHETGRSHAVVLRGEAGCGKSRLAAWMSQRAHEVGAATVLKASHHTIGSSGEGLAHMLERHLRCEGLDRAQVHARVRLFLRRNDVEDDEHLAAALTEVVQPAEGPEPEIRRVRFGDRRERFSAIMAFLEIAAQERPLIVWLDDAQWGSDALAFATEALDSGLQQTLFLVTVNDSHLPGRPQEQQLVDALKQRQDVTEHALAPLTSEELDRLLRRALHLAEPLVEQIRQRSAGNPLHALQLLGDWVQRAILTASPEGFVLATSELPTIPDNIYGVWQQRLRRILESHATPAATLCCLELAAALGRVVRPQEWRWSCRLAGFDMDADVVEELIAHGLAKRHLHGWEFTHSLLQETLERNAREQGRAEGLHRTCARMLAAHFPPSRASAQERRVRHLLLAHEHDEALALLLNLGAQHAIHDDYAQARHFLERYDQVVNDLGLADDDERRGAALPILADIYNAEGRPKVASTIAGEVIETAKALGWNNTHARARISRGIARVNRALFEMAERDFRLALDLARRNHRDRLAAQALRGLANVDMMRGGTALAEQALKQAYQSIEASGDEIALAGCIAQLALLLKAQGKYDAAREDLLQALAVTRHAGAHRFEAEILIALGDLCRQSSELDGAEVYYKQATDLSAAFGCNTVHIAQLNLGLLEVERANFEAASRILLPLEEVFAKSLQTLWLAWLRFVILPALAGIGSWDALDHHLREAARIDPRALPISPDLGYAADLAGRMLEEDGHPERAIGAYRLALAQWQVLGKVGQITSIVGRLASLDPDFR